MKLHLIDSNPEVAAALGTAFAAFPEVEIICGNLLEHAGECVVSPANSYGFMDGGFDKVLYGFFGPEIQVRVQDAISRRPEGYLSVGSALLVPTGEIVSIDPYDGDASVELSEDTLCEAISVFTASGEAPAAYGIDFGVLDTGETALVEANDGYSLGAYGIAAEPYTDLLFTRWQQLLSL